MASEAHHTLHSLDHAKTGMAAFLVTEAAFFGTLVMTYIFYLDQTRPIARDVLQLPLTIVASICLFSSSYTIHIAVKKLQSDDRGAFQRWLGLTILLGALFLGGTALEWREIIGRRGIWIDTDLFGTTYFTLVGFHAFHVSVGMILMGVVLGCALSGRIGARNAKPVDMVSWYWHFVDGVWVVVFSVVYLGTLLG
jgi:cytochrome c oxidase subunit III